MLSKEKLIYLCAHNVFCTSIYGVPLVHLHDLISILVKKEAEYESVSVNDRQISL